MEMKIEVQGIDRLREEFSSLLPRQIRFAALQAVDRTVDKTRDRMYSEMHKAFDRPTPYTLRALRKKAPTWQTLQGEVGFKEPWAPRAVKYLEPEVEGGPRKVKGFELAIQQRVTTMNPQGQRGVYPVGTTFVPGRGARLNAYGNISPGQIQQILSGLQAQQDRYANETPASRKRAKRTGHYWATQRGIWFVSGQRMEMVLVATKTKPSYPVRYPFYSLAGRFADQTFPGEFEVALREALEKGRT
jgi:hypothetical protein